MITQESVREKLNEKCDGLKVKYIAKQIGIPRGILSNFKAGSRELWQETLESLNEYLDKCQI